MVHDIYQDVVRSIMQKNNKYESNEPALMIYLCKVGVDIASRHYRRCSLYITKVIQFGFRLRVQRCRC